MKSTIKNAYTLFCAGIVNERGEVEIENHDEYKGSFISFPTNSPKYCFINTYTSEKNKMITTKEEFKNYKRHGKYINWYYNTNKKVCELNFKDGKRHGKGIYWYENGNKHFEIKYRNGEKYGKFIEWWENGIKASEVKYKNGKVNGIHTIWNNDGVKISEVKYKNDKIIYEEHYAWKKNYE